MSQKTVVAPSGKLSTKTNQSKLVLCVTKNSADHSGQIETKQVEVQCKLVLSG